MANDMSINVPTIKGVREETPGWAALEWKLIGRMEEAVELFRKKYVRDDGTLIWRDFWPGMDGADDAFEAFQNYPLLYALGGCDRLLDLAHSEWDTVAWQWTEYGQLHREFYSYYDWMHHGEGSLFLYYMGLADARSLKFKTRSIRFASFYDGEDAQARNYDAARKIIRSPINGSMGPRFKYSGEDWETHRAVLDGYLPPFEDIPGIPFVMGRCDWSGDETYKTILDFLNRRMAKGDVPLNLNATSLIAHAYLYTGDDKYKDWITDYLGAWEERTRRNGGVIPDNVGLSGEIGEYMDGKWWGGYYGWRWPHGSLTVVEPLITAGLNALLLTGERRWLDLARSQMDMLYEKRIEDVEGKPLVPHRHLDAGWSDFRRENTKWPVYLWSVTMDGADRERVGRLPDQQAWGAVAEELSKGNRMEIHPWYHYIAGKNPDFPIQTLNANLRAVERRIEEIAADSDDINAADIHHWQDKNPVICEALVQLMLGGSTNIYHGGLMHTPLRYFHGGRPGLPRGVGALVSRADSDGVTVAFHNTGNTGNACSAGNTGNTGNACSAGNTGNTANTGNACSAGNTGNTANTSNIGNTGVCAASFIVQGGCYGEHEIVAARLLSGGQSQKRMPVGAKYLKIELLPGEGVELRLDLRRFSKKPSYNIPGFDGGMPSLIIPRQIEN
jgi:hypothetical protein